MKEGKKWRGVEILTLCVLAFLLVFSVLNAHLLVGPLERLVTKQSGFSQFVAEVQAVYTENPAAKEQFVNANGLFARVIGQRLCNEVIRLNNGMLCDRLETPQNIGPVVNNLVEFDSYLSDRGIPFLYVQAPCKLDTDGELLPYGFTHFANSDADRFLALLDQNGVANFDLRPAFSKTAEMVEESFFRTDHHWNFTAALRAVPMVMERMDSLLPDQTLDMTYASFDQWEAHTLENWFLGSLGKRTGVFYSGVDDIVYYTPKFDTRLSRAVLNHRQVFSGDFCQANMVEEYARRRDYFNDSPYCIYVGGDYPLVEHRNAAAPNKLRVLIIKDSFALPLQCYLSAMFQEVDVIDPRYMEAGMDTVAEYASVNRPDIVLMVVNPLGSLDYVSYQDFGVAQELAREGALTGTRTPLFQGDIEIVPNGQDYSYGMVEVDLQPGCRYTLRCDSISLGEDSAPASGAMAAVYHSGKQYYVKTHLFDVDFCNQTGGAQWTFDVPASESGEVKLLLYAGLPGETAGVHLTYTNATLTLEG